MAHWLDYTLRDLLMFSPDVYWRLFALQNAALWPLPLVALATGILAFGLAARGRIRFPIFLLAAGWAGAAHFLATRYAPVNWPATYAAWAFGLQAVLLAVIATLCSFPRRRSATAADRTIGLALLAYAVLLHPFVGLGFARPLSQAEVAGIAPDPTALATLGLLLLGGQNACAIALAIIPLLWCTVTSITLLTLGESQGWILMMGPALWAVGHLSRLWAERPRA